jgi:hypothetical protein
MSKLVNDFVRLTEAQIEIDEKFRKDEPLTKQESLDFQDHMDLDLHVRALFNLVESGYTKDDIVGMLDKFEEFNTQNPTTLSQ